MSRGYFGIGIINTKTEANVGTLYRSALAFGASFVFTVGRRYRKQASDTPNTALHMPLFHWLTIDDLVPNLPTGCPLVGVEIHPEARDIADYHHPERACYLLGAEDHGLSTESLRRCHSLVRLPGERCLNVSVAGSIVMFDRTVKQAARKAVSA